MDQEDYNLIVFIVFLGAIRYARNAFLRTKIELRDKRLVKYILGKLYNPSPQTIQLFYY
jgi:hypothetical protein